MSSYQLLGADSTSSAQLTSLKAELENSIAAQSALQNILANNLPGDKAYEDAYLALNIMTKKAKELNAEIVKLQPNFDVQKDSSEVQKSGTELGQYTISDDTISKILKLNTPSTIGSGFDLKKILPIAIGVGALYFALK